MKKGKFALAERNTERVLNELFDRLYVLRNQIIHGGQHVVRRLTAHKFETVLKSWIVDSSICGVNDG